MVGTIYLLSDPETGEPRYVGKTEQGVGVRLSEHIRKAKYQQKTACQKWIKSLLLRGYTPVVDTLETAEIHIDDKEIYWISWYRSIYGDRILNHTDGGTGGSTTKGTKRPKSGPVSCLVCRVEWPSNLSLNSHYGSKHSSGSKTRSNNMKKAWKEGKYTARKPEPDNRTHCGHGHKFTENNTWINERGRKHCKECVKLAKRRYDERRRLRQ